MKHTPKYPKHVKKKARHPNNNEIPMPVCTLASPKDTGKQVNFRGIAAPPDGVETLVSVRMTSSCAANDLRFEDGHLLAGRQGGLPGTNLWSRVQTGPSPRLGNPARGNDFRHTGQSPCCLQHTPNLPHEQHLHS